MSNPESDPFASIVSSLQDDSVVEVGRVIYSRRPNRSVRDNMGYKADNNGRFGEMLEGEYVLYSCTPLEVNFRLPLHWIEDYDLLTIDDIEQSVYDIIDGDHEEVEQ